MNNQIISTTIKLFTLIIILTSSIASYAQSGSTDCKVFYDYDVAGNRIKREYRCTSTEAMYDHAEHTIFTSLFPNPTSGVFTGTFSEPTDNAAFMISASNGAIVQQFELNQMSSSVSFDISAQVPGTYFLTVWAFSKVETYTVIKMDGPVVSE